MTEPAVVSVMGSCISRDNFSRKFTPDYKRWFTVGPCTNQSSLIALMSPPVDTPWQAIAQMQPYGHWNVNSDLSREILGLLEAEQPAYVVLDFFGDVHFGVLETADGRVVTNNRWRLPKTDLKQKLLDEPGTAHLWFEIDEEAFLVRWREALDRFAEFMASTCPDTTVVVHRGFNTHRMITPEGVVDELGGARPRKHAAWVRRSNAVWDKLDDYAVEAHGWESIALRPEGWLTYVEHPWGPFDVHYTPDYNERFMAEMHAIDVKRSLPTADAAAVEELRRAARRRVRAEARFWRTTLAEAKDPAQPTGLRRLLPRRGPDLDRPANGTGPDHDLLESLRGRLAEDVLERLAKLPASADAHVDWLRSTWGPEVEAILARS